MRERVDRLEHMITEQRGNTDQTTHELATPPDHLTSPAYTPLSSTPFKKTKIKNCERLYEKMAIVLLILVYVLPAPGQAITKKLMTYTPSKKVLTLLHHFKHLHIVAMVESLFIARLPQLSVDLECLLCGGWAGGRAEG